MDSPRSRRSLPTRVAVAVACLVVLVVMGLAVLDWATDSLGLATDDDIVTDEVELARTEDRLDEVGQALNDLPAYERATADPAERGRCVTDSGDLFQPQVARVWTVSDDGGALASAISSDLSAMGWTVGTEDQFGVRELAYESDADWTASGSVFETYEKDAVVVEMRIVSASPCRLE